MSYDLLKRVFCQQSARESSGEKSRDWYKEWNRATEIGNLNGSLLTTWHGIGYVDAE